MHIHSHIVLANMQSKENSFWEKNNKIIEELTLWPICNSSYNKQ